MTACVARSWFGPLIDMSAEHHCVSIVCRSVSGYLQLTNSGSSTNQKMKWLTLRDGHRLLGMRSTKDAFYKGGWRWLSLETGRYFFDWNSDGSYSTTSMAVNAGGTFTTGDGGAGLWVQIAGMFMFTYNNSETTYSGNLASKSITGISTTFSGLNGSFYMLQAGAPTAVAASLLAHKPNSAGK